jgi:hypothetical protein
MAQGQLPYRDFFDNHMPLFQMACVPVVKALGEHGWIIIGLRFAMLVPYLICLWCVLRITQMLYPRALSPWAALAAAALPPFFYTSTEFRTDDAWAAIWLLSLVVALGGKFTPKRAFMFGVLLGVAMGISLKTVLMGGSVGLAVGIAMAIHLRKTHEGVEWKVLSQRVLLIVAGASLVPACIFAYFAAQGALWIMLYCVIQHNMLPGLRTWNRLPYDGWIFPLSAPFIAALGILVYRQAPDPATALRRAVAALTPCIYAALLVSYWREITREDYLPFVPLLPLVAIPLLLGISGYGRRFGVRGSWESLSMPLICVLELVAVWKANPLRTNRVQGTTHSLEDVLLLTRPGDYVMDAKGDNVFRPRPVYWVFEPLTKARIRKGIIRDRTTDCLVKTDTRVCYLTAEEWQPAAAHFIANNYLPCDPNAMDVGVAGKVIARTSGDALALFDVAIPAEYAVVSEHGNTAGLLDGAEYMGPVHLAAGRHSFRRVCGSGRAVIFLADALSFGFHPLLTKMALPAPGTDENTAR